MNTLTHLFDWLLAASLRASLLTLATLLIQAAFHRHLSARMRYALWLPVLVVLLMPVLPQSRWSIEHVFQTPPSPAQIIPEPISPAMESTPIVFEAAAPTPTPINWQRILLLSWLSVSAGMLTLGGVSFLLTLRRLKQARHPASDELLVTLAQIAREIHLRHVPRVLIASTVGSPAVTGLLRPTLLLPADFDREFTPAEARLVLKHELMHLKRGDLPLNALMCVLMALHWFNPLLWIAFFKIRADREAACDAQVLRDATRDHRIEYGHALLKVETAFCPRGFSLGFVGIFQRGSALRSRIQSIAAHRAPHPAMRVLITLCIVLMTFLGITQAQQPKPEADTPLIAIEMKIVEFKKATDWNFGGRMPVEETQSFLSALLPPDEFAVQLRELLKNDRTNVTSYPRIVTTNEKEVVIKSLVNQPSKDKEGKVFYVPIGLVCKFTPTMSGEAVNLGIDITDSDLFDPATGEVISEFKGEYANARSRVYKATQHMQAGQSCVIAGWHEGKPQSKRPILYIVTPHVIDPKKGGLPAAAPSDFAVGKSAFRSRDSMVITSMTRSAEMLTVGVDYELGSADEATASLSITSITDDKPSAFDARQQVVVNRGQGSFVLHLPTPSPGLPHVTFYDTLTHKPFGGIYFGTEAEAAKSQALDLSYMTSSTQAKAASSALNPPDKLGEIVITAKETSIDPSTEIQTAKGDARCQVAGLSIQAAELIFDRKAHQLKIRGPFTIVSGGRQKHSSTSSESSAVLDLASGKLTTSGAHMTEILTPPANKDQASSSAAPPTPPNAAEAKAAELRKARSQQYDFAKANLGDVLRFLATDASINFISLPEDNPINQRLLTFSIKSSPFEVLETLCRANGLELVLDQDRWFIRPSDDSEQITKAYDLPKTQASIETILEDLNSILGGDETKPAADKPQPSVTFKKEQNSVSVKATRLQHLWVSGYFKGLSGAAQATKTK